MSLPLIDLDWSAVAPGADTDTGAVAGARAGARAPTLTRPARTRVADPLRSRLPIVAARERVLAVLAGEVAQGPALEPCVCGAGRWAHSGANMTGRCEASGCARYRRDAVDLLVERALRGLAASLNEDLRAAERAEWAKRPKAAAGGLGIGPSDAGACRKAIEYRERPPADFTPDPEDKRPARIGTIIHTEVLRRRKTLYPWRQYGDLPGMSIAIDGLDRHGRFDEYDPITTRLTDIKTAGTWKWDSLGDGGPEEDTWGQLLIYALALIRTGRPVGEVELLYIERAGGKDESFVRAFNEAEALGWLNRLITTATLLDSGQPLPRDRSGPTSDGLCRGCFARSHCWDMTAAAGAGRSPESWVLLGPDPDRLAIEHLCAEYDAARADAKHGEERKDRAKLLLDGVEEGVYGEWAYGFSGGNPGKPKPDLVARVEQLEAYWDLPDGERPTLADLTYPQKTETTRKALSIKQAKREAAKQAAAQGPKRRPLPPPEDPDILDGEVVEDVPAPAAIEAGAA